ncbi:MAG: Electron transfer flavoprotein-ubiquinone oxidoreductase, partial [uncultured Thermoleophilia bacterium]
LRARRGDRDRGRHGRAADGAVELRPVRCDRREGRQADAARGRQRPRVHPDV